MGHKCSYCDKKVTKKTGVFTRGIWIHTACICKVEAQLMSGTISLNIPVVVSGEQLELVDVIPDRIPRTDMLRLDLGLAVHTLMEKGRVQEAEVLCYLLKGYTQAQLVKPLKVSRQRIGQIVQVLREELIEMGINEYGYAK